MLLKYTRPIFWLDANAGGGGGDDPPKEGDDPKNPDTKGKDGGEAGNEGDEEKKFTQNDVDKIVADRLARERKKAETEAEAEKSKAKREADKAKAEAEAQALKEKEEWKELAESLETRIAELEPLEGQLEETQTSLKRYQKALAAEVESRKEGLPEHIKDLLSKLDEVEQLEYIAANAEALNKKPEKIPETPEGDGDDKLSDEQKAQRQKSADSFYSNF